MPEPEPRKRRAGRDRAEADRNLPDAHHVRHVDVVTGESGCGKSAVGRRLAERLGWEYQEGDNLHPEANVAKMRAGRPFDDADRALLLAAVAAKADGWRKAGGAGGSICSALRRRYRDVLIGGRDDAGPIYLTGSRELIAEGLAGRRGHFMSTVLLDSQFDALEPSGADERLLTASAELPVDVIVDRLVTKLSPSRATIAAQP